MSAWSVERHFKEELRVEPVIVRGQDEIPREEDEPIEDWDEYFCNIAKAVKRKSKDKSPVGAVIVRDGDHVLLSTGYNGPPRQVLDLNERLADKTAKLSWMVHAEANAVYNAVRSGASLAGGTIYVTKFPCVTCAGAIIQVGLVRVYTLDNGPWRHDMFDDGCGSNSLRILNEAGIQIHAPNFNFGISPMKEAPQSQASRLKKSDTSNGRMVNHRRPIKSGKQTVRPARRHKSKPRN